MILKAALSWSFAYKKQNNGAKVITYEIVAYEQAPKVGHRGIKKSARRAYFSPIPIPDLGACLQANEIGDNQAMTKKYQFKLVIFVNRPIGTSTRLFVVIMMQIIAVQYTWSCFVGRFDDSGFSLIWQVWRNFNSLASTPVDFSKTEQSWQSLAIVTGDYKNKSFTLTSTLAASTSVNLSNLHEISSYSPHFSYPTSGDKSLVSIHLPLLVEICHVCRNLVKPAVLTMFVK